MADCGIMEIRSRAGVLLEDNIWTTMHILYTAISRIRCAPWDGFKINVTAVYLVNVFMKEWKLGRKQYARGGIQ